MKKYFTISSFASFDLIASLSAFALGLFVFFQTGCATDDALKRTTGTQSKNANAASLPAIPGPKPTLAVTSFANQGGWRGRWDLGRNLTGMLESAMFDTGRFRMVDRSSLGSVLSEQDLKRSGRAVGSGAKSGQIQSARYIAEGAITEVSEDTQGTGGGIRLPIGNTGVKVGGAVGKAQITTVLKVIDTTTSEIVAKQTIRGKSGKVKVNIGVQHRKIGGEFGSFARTPIGEAAQDVINQAAAFVADSVAAHAAAHPAAPTTVQNGKVAMIDGSLVVINRGSQHGVFIGQRFETRSGGEEIRDPDTGEIIGVTSGNKVATLEVVEIQGRMSRAKVVEGSLPQAGFTVVPR